MPRPLFKTVPVQSYYFGYKATFRKFEQSNIDNDSKWATKNHVLSSTLCIFVKESKFQNRLRPPFKTVSAQMHYFAWKTTFSKFFSTQIFAMKVDGAIKTIFYLTHYTFLLKCRNFKTDHTHFSKLCLLKRVVSYTHPCY